MFIHLLAVAPDLTDRLQAILDEHPSRVLKHSRGYYMGYNVIVATEENIEELFWEADILCKVIEV
jgi:hypothetical protein